VRDDLWADRLLEEIDNSGAKGLVIIDDLRYPGEYAKLVERGAFRVRLVVAHPRGYSFDDPGRLMANTEGLLWGSMFDAEVPAKGLVPQEVLEKLIADLWRDRISPWMKA
jgi:hypothetical protein